MTRAEINRQNQAKRTDYRTNRRFTEEECAAGGAEARYRERQRGIKLNHGRLFGKRERRPVH